MIRILFICHGNICRSPMAESVMAYLVRRLGLEEGVQVSSAAAHTDELGSPPHPRVREVLLREKIPLVPHRARLLTREDGERYQLLIGMDEYNIRDILRIIGQEKKAKVRLLLSRPVADPWYTGDFDTTYRDVRAGCEALLEEILRGEKIPYAHD